MSDKEQEFTLEDAIRDMLADSGDIPEDEPETDDEPEESPEPETEEEPETPPEESTEEEAEEELEPETPDDPDLEAKLAELETKYGKVEEDNAWAHLDQQEEALQVERAYLESGFLNGRQDIRNDNGKSIYEMNDAQFDDFLAQLDDDGKERLKVTAIREREEAVNAALEYQQRWNAYNSNIQQHSQAKLEREVIDDLAKQLKLPEVIQRYKDGTITKHLTEKAQTDPSIAKKAASKEGLYQLAVMAIRDLKLVKSKDQEVIKQPSAPDAKTVSKKVKPKSIDANNDEALLARVSKNPKEWNKLAPDVRERLMYASIRDQL
jgi:hypothetical protein